MVSALARRLGDVEAWWDSSTGIPRAAWIRVKETPSVQLRKSRLIRCYFVYEILPSRAQSTSAMRLTWYDITTGATSTTRVARPTFEEGFNPHHKEDHARSNSISLRINRVPGLLRPKSELDLPCPVWEGALLRVYDIPGICAQAEADRDVVGDAGTTNHPIGDILSCIRTE